MLFSTVDQLSKRKGADLIVFPFWQKTGKKNAEAKPAALMNTFGALAKPALGSGDFEGNAARIVEVSLRVKAAGAGMVLFPELSICGYPPRDLVERPSFVEHNRTAATYCPRYARHRCYLWHGYARGGWHWQIGNEFRSTA